MAHKGTWSVATAYKKGDIVLFLGSSYITLNAVAAGGTNPRVDTTNWGLLASGSSEIAYAEYTAANIVGVNNATADVPGVQIVVPAGAPSFALHAFADIRHTATAANFQGISTLIIYDVDAAAPLKLASYRSNSPTTAWVAEDTLNVWTPLPATPTARTFKLQVYTQFADGTITTLGPGTAASAPAPFLRAVTR
jgi:hypothetical protein